MAANYLNHGFCLPLMELFYSIQGEGFHAGEAAVFIRIGGCDVGCNWCDEKESWNAEHHPLTAVEKIVEDVCAFPCSNVLVTGGEPLNFSLDELCKKLKEHKLITYLETSGAGKYSGYWDWLCLSPKRNSPPLAEIYNKADELKVIIENEDDFLWAEENAERVGESCKLYLQPEWSRRKEATAWIVDYIGSNPRWKLSVQVHKYIGIP